QLETLEDWLNDPDWHRRLAGVQELSLKEDDETVSLLVQSLSDENPQVRRLSAATLGVTGNVEAVRPLCHSLLHDSSVGVRRTAGDALSDIGDSSAQASMIESLKDQNKLVRWRAARFLNDLGTEKALPALELAKDDPECEVQLEINAAIEKIQKGGQGLGPVWKRIVELD
ncbi:MAG: HEAT repeat domain-containing protein, partial [Cyanobacteria bacterium TGS_CYA1]|nr:HEAT repeat domain-containing protein [Cyanobacteria bacterium TGS_CYA1]